MRKEPYVEATNGKETIFSTAAFIVLAETGEPLSTEVSVLANASKSEMALFFVALGMTLASRGMLDESIMRLRSAVSGRRDHSSSPQVTISA